MDEPGSIKHTIEISVATSSKSNVSFASSALSVSVTSQTVCLTTQRLY